MFKALWGLTCEVLYSGTLIGKSQISNLHNFVFSLKCSTIVNDTDSIKAPPFEQNKNSGSFWTNIKMQNVSIYI